MPIINQGGSSGGSGPVFTASVALTAAQIRGLNSTPVTIVSAQGAGLAAYPVGGALESVFGTTPFGLSSSAIEVTYGGGSTNLAHYGDILSLYSSRFTTALLDGGPLTLATAGNAPLTLFLPSAQATTHGAIGTNVKNAAGTGYAAGNTGLISGGDANAVYVVLTTGGGGSVATYRIGYPGTNYVTAAGAATAHGQITVASGVIALNQAAKTFSMYGNYTGLLASPVTSLTITSSTGNDGTYTIVSSSYAAGITTVVVSQAIPSSVVDGDIRAGTGGAGNDDFTVDISTVVLGDGTATVTLLYGVVAV